MDEPSITGKLSLWVKWDLAAVAGGGEQSQHHTGHSPRARQKSRKASWLWTPQAWSFSRGGSRRTSASRPSVAQDAEEEVEEEEEDVEDMTEWLVPAEDREVEVSVREGVMEKEYVEEKQEVQGEVERLWEIVTCKTERRWMTVELG